MSKTDESVLEEQIKWIRSGKMGCAYSTFLVTQRQLIGWKFIVIEDIFNYKFQIDRETFLMSIVFPNDNIVSIKEWAISNNFFIEKVDEFHEGLRFEINNKKAWVLYFGPDSHWKTRQSPYPMLMLNVKIPKVYHFKVLMKGVLSVAHASLEYISERQNDTFWKQSHIMSKKILGYSPKKEDAMATFLYKKKQD